jgi:hypothetical protein
MKLEYSRQIFQCYWNIKFHENPSGRSRVLPCGRIDKQTNMTNVMKNQQMSLFRFYSYIDGSLHVSGPKAHPQENSHSCSHNQWSSGCTVRTAWSVCGGWSWWLFSTGALLSTSRKQSPWPATTYRARGPNGTATEPLVVWTAVWILLRMGLWARNMQRSVDIWIKSK